MFKNPANALVSFLDAGLSVTDMFLRKDGLLIRDLHFDNGFSLGKKNVLGSICP